MYFTFCNQVHTLILLFVLCTPFIAMSLQDCTVTVRGLTEFVSKQDLADAFGEYGEVSSVVWKLDQQMEQTGVGFIIFQDTESAQKALAAKSKGHWPIAVLEIAVDELETLKKDQDLETKMLEMYKTFSAAGKKKAQRLFQGKDPGPQIKIEPVIERKSSNTSDSVFEEAFRRGKPPKLPIFSGDVKDSSFARWQFHVKVLQGRYDDATICEAAHQSLKSPAADVFVNTSQTNITADEMIEKLRTRYGCVLPLDALREKLYSLRQDKEDVTKWAFNVEEVVYQIEERGGTTHREVESMVKSRFWYGLKESRIREATRASYQGVTFDHLLVECRTLEAEYSATSSPHVQVHQQTSLESKMDELLTCVKSLNTRVEKLEKSHKEGQRYRSPKRETATKEKNPTKCTKCKLDGHLYFGCRKDNPEVICRRCKSPGHLANCCRSLNSN